MTVSDDTTVFVGPGVTASDNGYGVLEAPAARTLQADVLAELKRTVHREPITLAVPDRPGWSVDYSVELNADLLAKWSKSVTTNAGTPEAEADLFQLALLGLAGQCLAIRRDGEVQELDGKPLTFTHPAIADLYGSLDVTVTVREFYANDAMIAATWARIQEAAGAGSLDPTTASSA